MLPRRKPFVILCAGMIWPRYEDGEVKAGVGIPWLRVNDAVMSLQSRGDAYLCPCPAFLTMTIGQRGYRVYQPGMEDHIASNQGATRGYGLSLVGPQDGHGLSLP